MQPPDGSTKTAYVKRHVQDDLSLQSHGHIARVVVSGAMITLGLGIIALKYILGVIRETPMVWGHNELLLVLSLIGGGLAILFTHTFLSVMHVIWPFGKN